MKIEELSVGDWVSVSSNGFSRITAVYLTPMGEMVELLKGEKYSRNFTEFIEPIPLTPEILEKNGFVEICGDFVVTRNGFYINVEAQENRFGLEVSADGHIITACDVEFVHQLQHALRLAGVKKEIEL